MLQQCLKNIDISKTQYTALYNKMSTQLHNIKKTITNAF